MKTKKMKRAIMSLGMAALLCACNNNTPVEEQGGMELNFNVLQVEQIPMSRAALKDACTSVNYFRYTNGELEKSVSQTSSDNQFGTFSDYLTWGTHELCFVGHNSTAMTEDGGIVSFDKVTDTFSHYIRLNVNSETSKNQSFTLTRRVAKFEILVLDALPADVASVKIEVTGGSTSLNLRTGHGNAIVKQTKTINIPSNLIGTTDNKFATFIFLPDGVTEVSIISTTLDEDGEELVEYDFGAVEVQTNYITRYKGRLFGMEPAFTLSVNDEWTDVWENEFN